MKRFLLLLVAALILIGAEGHRYDNLVLGVPGRADTSIDHEGYALGYIELHEQPAWVIYRLTAEEVRNRVSSAPIDSVPIPRFPPEAPSGGLSQLRL